MSRVWDFTNLKSIHEALHHFERDSFDPNEIRQICKDTIPIEDLKLIMYIAIRCNYQMGSKGSKTKFKGYTALREIVTKYNIREKPTKGDHLTLARICLSHAFEYCSLVFAISQDSSITLPKKLPTSYALQDSFMLRFMYYFDQMNDEDYCTAVANIGEVMKWPRDDATAKLIGKLPLSIKDQNSRDEIIEIVNLLSKE